jgi:hypothetical protein
MGYNGCQCYTHPFKNSAKLAELQQLAIDHVTNPLVRPFSPQF